MIVEQLFDINYIFLDVNAISRDELLTKLSKKLYEGGLVKDSFSDAIIAREYKYPTGLPTKELKVAIPHVDIEHVCKSCICVARLEKPVVFKEMGNGSNDIEVEMVFLLALNDKNSHLDVLQKVIGLFSQPSALNRLKNANSKEEILKVIIQFVENGN